MEEVEARIAYSRRRSNNQSKSSASASGCGCGSGCGSNTPGNKFKNTLLVENLTQNHDVFFGGGAWVKLPKAMINPFYSY